VQPHLPHRLDQRSALRATISARSSDISPAIGSSTSASLLALREHHGAAADLAQAVGGQRHVGLVGADDDHVVAVVRDGRGHGAVRHSRSPRRRR
jgi:hypothetical protein